MNHDAIKEFAEVRNTSIEIAEAIFEVANNDETLAQQIWEEGNDKVLEIAFSKTDKDTLFWGTESVSRNCAG